MIPGPVPPLRKAQPDLELRIEFRTSGVETYITRGDINVDPELIAKFLRQLADQIEHPDIPQLARLIKPRSQQ